MNNVILDFLPDTFVDTDGKEYLVNTDFRIGIQIMELYMDNTLLSYEKRERLIALLFSDDDESIREYPSDHVEQCAEWLLNGWSHDKTIKENSEVKLMDFDVDQWRIYADFIAIYRINLSRAYMHYWEFMGLLWNMPYEVSSFLHVIDIRKRKIRKNASKEEKEALKRAKTIYSLGSVNTKKFSAEEESKIDDYDRMMEQIKKKKSGIDEAVKEFERR